MRKSLLTGINLFTLLCAVVAMAAATMGQAFSKEESLIRQAYQKTTALHQAELKKGRNPLLDRPERKSPISFVISRVHGGPIDEILYRPVEEFATLPVGDIIQFGIVQNQHGINDRVRISLTAEWGLANYASMNDSGMRTFRQTFDMMGAEYADVTRYLAYEVTVTLFGKQRHYKAIALFHGQSSRRGREKIEFWDSIAGFGGGITNVYNELRPALEVGRLDRNQSLNGSNLRGYDLRVVPAGALTEDAPAGTAPADEPVSGEMGVLQRSDYAGTQSLLGFMCDSGICCPYNAWSYSDCCWDPYDLFNPGYMPTCSLGWGGGGVVTSGGGPACSPTTYGGAFVSKFSSDRKGHKASGDHGAFTDLYGQCEIKDNCTQICDVLIGTNTPYETGQVDWLIWPTYHIGGKTVSSKSASADKSATISCGAGVGYAFKECWFPWCSITVSGTLFLGIGTASMDVSGGDLFQVKDHALQHTCISR
ncbi:MAG: hypothetical protein IPM66_18005 [Acidobacteriota bacterium]|nr:MAG: hypothetical protein IPM66_18005 [Acidobacteriota bacterium]